MNLHSPTNQVPLPGTRENRVFRLVVFLTLVHIPLGLALYNSQILALLYPLIVFFIGLYFAWNKETPLEKVAIVTAYLIGSEVLWRMAESSIFWEFGKYSISIILLLALSRRSYFKIPLLPLIYFLLLLPSCFITILEHDWEFSRNKLSSIMSGPLLLFISCYFFSYLKLDRQSLERLLLSIIIPLISVACTTFFYTISTPDLVFIDDSNAATSGGFGPNQVSSALGLGVVAAFLCLIIKKQNYKYKIFLSVTLLFLAIQSALTFSRGGLYNAGFTVLTVLLITFWDPQYRTKVVLTISTFIAIIVFVFPFVDNFTEGALSKRFQEIETTGRAEIAEADLEVWLNNPIFGVGVGNSYETRREYLNRGALAHTEFTRLLSEHGIPGLLAITVFLAMTGFNFMRQKDNFGKAFVAACTVWSFMFMLNAAMRLGAPSYFLGLCFATLTTVRWNDRIFRPRRVMSFRIPKRNPS